jgi:hypothetical protein
MTKKGVGKLNKRNTIKLNIKIRRERDCSKNIIVSQHNSFAIDRAYTIK